ncbi:TPA: hypothetical protein N0F65_006145 [Lagenidium giganteum]|uniref:Peptidase M13 C-terminal domain-containing protein n=1 Tax=Lagenidium giganteum TaxID=4803 RepID=A0AAV2Z563_9STRA|nr:TPA: hypothetical protein N0F65_006145 [Lagenidium giganteum]
MSCISKQYSSVEVYGGNGNVIGTVNSNITVEENIADNGGVKVARAAYHAFLKDHPHSTAAVNISFS